MNIEPDPWRKTNRTRRTPAPMPGWHLCLRLGPWMLTKAGLFRYEWVEVWSRTTGKRSTRYNWRVVMPRPRDGRDISPWGTTTKHGDTQ